MKITLVYINTALENIIFVYLFMLYLDSIKEKMTSKDT